MYKGGARLGPEFASKLGHLEVLESQHVNKLLEAFDKTIDLSDSHDKTIWSRLSLPPDPLPYVFAVDGSISTVSNSTLPKQEVSFVKTALFFCNEKELSKIDPQNPHPLQLKKIMANSATHHATVFPLKNVRIKGENVYNSVRKIIFESFQDPSLQGLIYETYKWLLYREWDPKGPKDSLLFDCPHLDCSQRIKSGMPSGSDTWKCPHCGGDLYCTDVLGFHQEMSEDTAPEALSQSYMLIHEMLSIFSAIRYFWLNNKPMLGQSLFIKDGPLSLRSQYSKLVPSIRDFISHAFNEGHPIYLIGQEKTGAFRDHLSTIDRFAPPLPPKEPLPYQSPDKEALSYSVLTHHYVRNEVQRMPNRENEYGLRTNYGEKIYVKVDPYTSLVLNIPTTGFREDDQFPSETEIIGLTRILQAIPSLVSPKHEGALTPIVLANGIASLSNYPSANVLRMFAGLS